MPSLSHLHQLLYILDLEMPGPVVSDPASELLYFTYNSTQGNGVAKMSYTGSDVVKMVTSSSSMIYTSLALGGNG